MLITREELALRKVTLDRVYPAGVFDDREHLFRQGAPLRVQAIAELVGSDIRVRGHVSTRLGVECDRCLGPMELGVEQDFDLAYRPVAAIARSEEAEVHGGELDVGFYPGDGVELEEMLREQVILVLPMKRICQPDCRGLCPVCGSNLNAKACECHQQVSTGSPFAVLLGPS